MWKTLKGWQDEKNLRSFARRKEDMLAYQLSRFHTKMWRGGAYFILMRGLTALRKGEPKMHWDANQEKGLLRHSMRKPRGKTHVGWKMTYQIPEVAWFFMTDTLWNTAANITTTHTITVLHYIEPPFYSDKGTFFHSAQHSTAIRADSQQLLCNL